MSKTIETLKDKVIIQGKLLYPMLSQGRPHVDSRFGKVSWSTKVVLEEGKQLETVLKLLEKFKIKTQVRPTTANGHTFQHTIEIKTNAKPFTNKNGENVERSSPTVVDSKGKALEQDVIRNIGNLSTGRVAFRINKHTVSGVAYMQLLGVQILDLVEYSKQGALFDEADGFVADMDKDVTFDSNDLSDEDLSKI